MRLSVQLVLCTFVGLAASPIALSLPVRYVAIADFSSSKLSDIMGMKQS
jgi:hypothetical protein